MFAGDGDDRISSILDGRSHIYGEGGDDVILPSSTHKSGGLISSGDGNDLVQLSNSGVGWIIHGDTGNDTLLGASSIDHLYGGSGDDQLSSGSGGDVIKGGGGDDVILKGDDGGTLSGDGGNDTIIGGNGDDLVDGGKGADSLTGGDGNDTFRFDRLGDSTVAAPDVITDLHSADVIDLSAIDADATQAGNQPFVLVQTFDNHAGEIQLTYDPITNLTALELDIDGDGRADAQIDLVGDQRDFTNFIL